MLQAMQRASGLRVSALVLQGQGHPSICHRLLHRYWAYDRGACSLKSSALGMKLGTGLISGYYDPCRDANNFEPDVKYSGKPVREYRNVPNAAQCCRKCVEYKGCVFWTLVTEGVNSDICWLMTEATRQQDRHGSISGAFVARKRPS